MTIGIAWTTSAYCWALLCIPLICIFAWVRLAHSARTVKLLAGKRMKALIAGYAAYKPYLRFLLITLAALSLGCAVLQPRWGFEEEMVQHEGRDLLVAIDISRSMLAKDYESSRLELAKDAIKKLVSALSCERVGLLLFASSAWVQCPLTEDYDAIKSFVDMIDYDSVSSGSTDIAAPIMTALDLYERMPSKKNKILVLVTDGEDLVGNLSSMQQRAHDAGLSLFVIGLGTQEGAPIPCYDEHGSQMGHIMHEDGSIVISRLCEEKLRGLVSGIGGNYIGYDHHDQHIKQLIDAVERYEKELYHESSINKKKLQYPWFVGGALLCAGLEFLL
jgi:Ca-activated chloride channel family protein